jgi:hypothetical protein
MFKLENYLYELSLSYNIKKLFNEVRYTEITPYFQNNPNKDSWFCGPNTWLHGNIKNLNSPELRSLITQLEESIKTKNMKPTLIFQKKGSSVPSHIDAVSKAKPNPNLCSVNLQLTEKVSPIKFNKKDFVTYHCALINTKKKHGVPKIAEDRFFIKFKIFDLTYKEALSNYLKYRL